MTQVASPAPEYVLLPSDRAGYDAMVRMSWDEWLDWEHPGLSDWIDGTAYIDTDISWRHQDLVGFLLALLNIFGRWKKAGVVRSGPYALRSRQGSAGREPDVLFVLTEHAGRKQRRYFEGAPDIVFEVISEGSVGRDRTEKLLEYQELGVPEYWLIDSRPGLERPECYRLGPEGRYHAVPPGDDGAVRSQVLAGFYLREAWLQAEDPDVLAAFQELTAP